MSRSSYSLSGEKLEKIRNLPFPATKKEALSRASFFSYFIDSVPRLSELMGPLRRLARPKVRFTPTDEDRQAFESLKNHLLDPRVGVIRMPSSSLSDTIIVWTDASQNTIGALITQMLYPLPHTNLDPSRRYLTIIGCWSRRIDETWSPHPIWNLELIALDETVRKFRFLLEGRPFYVMTDSSTVRAWASLELVPLDISRRIMRLQVFNFKILFVESRLNASDWVTRLDASKPDMTFSRFLEDRVVNANGDKMGWEELFSEKKFEDATGFFHRSRRQNMARAVAKDERNDGEVMDDDGDEERCIVSYAPEAEDANQASVRIESASAARKLVHAVAAQGAKGWRSRVDSIDVVTLAAFGLDDDEVDEGMDEMVDDAVIDDDTLEGVSLPSFDWESLREALKLQENDETIAMIIDFIVNEKASPDKTKALGFSLQFQQFLRHRSLFRLSKQHVLFRLWVRPDGLTDRLIVVGGAQFEELVRNTHRSPTSPLRHLGIRKTFNAISNTYFAFGARRIVLKIVSQCGNCALNRFHATRAEKSGNQISLAPNEDGMIDVAGPIHGFGASPSTGRGRYVLVYVDLHSRLAFASVVASTDDSAILKALVELRDRLSGLPKRMWMDNALVQPGSTTESFLKERGVRITHGMPTVSRCQAKVERLIGSLTRLFCKIHTDQPELSFPRIVAEAILIHNNSPSDGLPQNLSPNDIHFARAPSTFPLITTNSGACTNQFVKASRLASRKTVVEDVRRFLRRQKLTSPTDYSRKLKVGDLCLRRRTSFAPSAPKKLQFRLKIEAYEITSKLATNAFHACSLMDNRCVVLPGDVLIKVASLSKEELRALCREMETIAARSNALSTPISGTDDRGRGVRRSARVRARSERIEADLSTIFT